MKVEVVLGNIENLKRDKKGPKGVPQRRLEEDGWPLSICPKFNCGEIVFGFPVELLSSFTVHMHTKYPVLNHDPVDYQP
jgi:hypothetical protein